jgi:hypothetical protein
VGGSLLSIRNLKIHEILQLGQTCATKRHFTVQAISLPISVQSNSFFAILNLQTMAHARNRRKATPSLTLAGEKWTQVHKRNFGKLTLAAPNAPALYPDTNNMFQTNKDHVQQSLMKFHSGWIAPFHPELENTRIIAVRSDLCHQKTLHGSGYIFTNIGSIELVL